MTPETTGQERAPASHAADDATKGSAIKLAAEVLSRLLTLGTTVLIARGLGVAGLGVFSRLWMVAPLIAEVAEFGLQATASRSLVAGTLSLRAFLRARAATLAVVGALVLFAALGPAALAIEAAAPAWLHLGVLGVLFLFFALSGWGEFLGVALRCRGARLQEGLVLLVLRGCGLVLAAAALALGAGLLDLAGALAVSTVPALVLGAWLLRRHPAAVQGPDSSVARVLRVSAPLAVYGGLLLLSPRVEFLVLMGLRGDYETGLYFSALNVLWPLSLVPNAVASGAMPALTREALAGRGAVRARTAATLALFAAPGTVGLLLVSPALVPFIFGSDFAPAAVWLRILSLALVPLFINGLVSWSLIAAEKAGLLPRLLAIRIVVAFALALVLVPRFGASGAAVGFVLAEIVLLVLGLRACAAARFAVPIVKPVALAFALTIPMALAVSGVGSGLFLALPVGVLTFGATVAAAWWLLPGVVRSLLGEPEAGGETA